MNSFHCYLPTHLHFGCGVLKELATTPMPGKKALLVTSQGPSLKNNGTIDRVRSLLLQNHVETVLFDRIHANPVLNLVNEGSRMIWQHGCDFVVGLGGGSAIDSAKAIAVSALYGGDYWNLVSGGSGKGIVPKQALPVIAIVTTAGTGTEADPWTVVTKPETQEKIGCGWEITFPRHSFVDPELMTGIPPKFTAYQGFDAFFHAAEGFLSKVANPVSDLYAQKSLQLLYRNLANAVNDGMNLKARTNVALASMLSGCVETFSSCMSQHSLEHAMSAFHPDLPHGAGLILLSQAYFRFFAQATPLRMAEMANFMLQRNDATAADFLHALREMQQRCGVASLRMADFGITEEEFPQFAANAKNTMGALFAADPAELSDAAIQKIYQDSFRQEYEDDAPASSPVSSM